MRKILGFSDSKSLFVPVWQDADYFNLLIELAEKKRPIIYYVGAANGDNPQRTLDFFKMSKRLNFDARLLPLFGMTNSNPDDYFKDADAILIGGGATRNLVALMREWKADQALESAYHRGVLIAGTSAGIGMLFDTCISDSIQTSIAPLPGIGMIEGTLCPHYDVREERRTVLAEYLLSADDRRPAYGLEDGVAALFVNGLLDRVFSLSREGCLHTFWRNGKYLEQEVRVGQSPLPWNGTGASAPVPAASKMTKENQ